MLKSTTSSVIAFDFTRIFSGPSRADEIRVLFVKNKPPKRGSRDNKPGGWGLPTGQANSCETPEGAAVRELRDETGYVGSLIGKVRIIEKPQISNTIHLWLVEVGDLPGRITEREEIAEAEWFSLRDIFERPYAVEKDRSRNPEGFYFSHIQRLAEAMNAMLFEPETLIEAEKISAWMKRNPKEMEALRQASDELAPVQ